MTLRMPAARTAVKSVGTVRRPRAGRYSSHRMRCTSGGYAVSIETWEGRVLEGMIVRASHVYAPRAASAWMLAVSLLRRASGRRPSTETITTWRGSGVGDGDGTGAVGLDGETPPQAVSRTRSRISRQGISALSAAGTEGSGGRPGSLPQID